MDEQETLGSVLMISAALFLIIVMSSLAEAAPRAGHSSVPQQCQPQEHGVSPTAS